MLTRCNDRIKKKYDEDLFCEIIYRLSGYRNARRKSGRIKKNGKRVKPMEKIISKYLTNTED